MAVATHEASLTRGDLTGYDSDCIDLALEAASLGWTGKMSTRGHLILRAPDGETTMSISRSGTGRNLKNMRANLERWKRKQRKDGVDEMVADVLSQYEREQFIDRMIAALDTETGEVLPDEAADVMRTVYSIVLEREEIADFAYSLAKEQRIRDFGWLSGHPDDLSELRAWNVNWAVFDRRDGRVIDLGGPRTAPDGSEWTREYVEVKVAEQLAWERKRPDGLTEPEPEVMEEHRPYICEVCGRTFKAPHNLGRHKSTKHKNLRFEGDPEEESLDHLMESNPIGHEPVVVQMDDRLTVVADLHTNEVAEADGPFDTDVAETEAVAAILRVMDDLGKVGLRMAQLEGERVGYDARLAEITAHFEEQIATLTAERDSARESLAALKQIVADL